MDWVWQLYEGYILKLLKRRGITEPRDEELETLFVEALRDSTVTILVQEPWLGSVRFKCLAKYDAADIFELFNNPFEFLSSKYGGGKFKINFHHGWNFVATKNFKPAGEPLWMSLPALEPESFI